MRSVLIIGLVCQSVAWAGEDAVLSTGYRIHADRHESLGATTRLYIGEGTVELATSSIDRFEEDEAVLPPAPAVVIPEAAPEVMVVPEAPPSDPAALAAWTARKHGLPAEFVASVMEAESGMRPEVVSPKGAIGLMQLMPETAKSLGVDPHVPAENAEGGVRYLRSLLGRYQSSPEQVLLALAAYNAGPEAVARYRGVPPYAETRAYIIRVVKNWERRRAAR